MSQNNTCIQCGATDAPLYGLVKHPDADESVLTCSARCAQAYLHLAPTMPRYQAAHKPDPKYMGAWAILDTWIVDGDEIVGRAGTEADAIRRASARNVEFASSGAWSARQGEAA